MIQRTTRDYQVSLWSLQDSFIAVLKQYGLEYRGQIQNGKLADRDDGTQTFSFDIPMYYIKDGKKISNPGWYSIKNGALLVNMRKIKVIFNKDNNNKKIYEFLIVKVDEKHDEDNSLYCSIECQGLAFHELGKIGYKIALSDQDFYNDDYDWATTGKWNNVAKSQPDTTQPLATLNYWNDKVFNTINNWTYEIHMDWDSHSLEKLEKQGVTQDYTIQNDVITYMSKRDTNKVYQQDFVDSWKLQNNELVPAHITETREKARISVNIQDSNIYNITQSLAETFGVFCKYIYDYDENYHIIGRKVIYYNNFLNEKDGIIDIIYPYQTNYIKRNIDSTDLVTKLYVKGIENENGILSIIDVGANKSQEDYLLNFDYLYKIGGITQQQYAAVEQYIIKIRDLNEKIAPVSAKVISLQSQLVNIQAELTTRRNAIALDTEQLLANTALLDSITNGTEILSITESNPQTVVLIEDTGQHRTKNYYVKITQKGVYPQTIKIYKDYSYQTSKLSNQITTGIVNFDQSGEVIKITNLYVDANDSNTVYITYDYRPQLFYERIVKMWENRLHEDTINKQKLQQELALLNYSLYGDNSEYSLNGINVANLIEFNVYNRYLNLIQQKQKLIKEFNAIMGPALREGYWQPEDYNDYGDKYNDKFLIQLDNPAQQDGSTGNSYFIWDDEAFQGQQELYYQYSAAQYLQAYPCIDLSTENGQAILRMIANNPDYPISFVYKPVTSEESDKRPRYSPSIITNKVADEIVLIPNLYTWADLNDNENSNVIFTDAFTNNAPQELINLLLNNNQYNGSLNFIMTEGWKQDYTSFYWQLDQNAITDNNIEDDKSVILFNSISGNNNPITSNFISNCRIISQENSYPYQLRLLSNSTEPYVGQYNYITLFAQNYKTSQDQHPHASCIIRELQHSRLQQIGEPIQLQLKNNLNSSFIAKYKVINDYHINDQNLNYYTWTISINNQSTNINYIEGKESESSTITIGNKTLSYNIDFQEDSDHNIIHILTISHGFNLFNKNTLIEVKFNVKNPNDFIQNLSGVTGNSFEFYPSEGEPQVITYADNSDITSIQLNQTRQFILNVQARLIDGTNSAYISDLAARWQIKNNNEWTNINFVESPLTFDSNLFTIQQSNININNNIVTASLMITVNSSINLSGEEEASTFINGKEIRATIVNSQNKNENDNNITYKYFNSLLITNPIEYNDENVQELIQPEIILLQPNGLSGQNYTEKIISIQTTNATIYTWYIIPADSINQNEPIELIVNNSISTQSTQNNRYTVIMTQQSNTAQSISQLKIRIPIIGQDDALRDNGTKIRCICSNSSGQMANIYLPNKNDNNEDNWTQLQVSYPIIIDKSILNDNKQWWAIEGKEYNVGTLFFKIPVSMIKTNSLQNSIENFSIISSINKILYQEEEENLSENIMNSFIVSYDNIEIDNTLTDNQFVVYKINISLVYDNDISNITYNNNSIILQNSTENDKKYKLNLRIYITYSYTQENVPQSQINIPILIRQNIPEINDNIIINNNTYIEYQYTNNAQSGSTIINPPINLSAYTDNIYSVKPQSVSKIQWCNANQGDGVTIYASWSIPQNQQIITINNKKTRYENNKNIIPGLNNLFMGNSIGYILGYDKQLYLKATNNWGTLTSKHFTFIQENNSN